MLSSHPRYGDQRHRRYSPTLLREESKVEEEGARLTSCRRICAKACAMPELAPVTMAVGMIGMDGERSQVKRWFASGFVDGTLTYSTHLIILFHRIRGDDAVVTLKMAQRLIRCEGKRRSKHAARH